MKKLAATIVSGFWVVAAVAQGTVWFSNLNPLHGVDAPVFFLASTNRVAGPNYLAQLYAGLTPDTLVAVGSPAPFYSGSAAGYFVGGAITIPFVAPGGTVYCEVHAWDTTLGGTTTGATESQAYAYSITGPYNVWGSSLYGLTCFDPVRPPFAVVTGNPFATPPDVPPPLIGLQSFTLGVPVPEPSLWAFAAGVGALLAARWRTKRRVQTHRS